VPAPKPRGKDKSKASSVSPPTKSGKVRFHEEVLVRNIKAKGKNLPLSTMYEDDDDDEDEYGEQMIFNDFEAGMEGGAFEEGEDEEMAGFNFREEDDSGDDSGEVESEGDDGRDTMARLKDDLFADEDEPQTGLYIDISPQIYH
jgi:U3 small nucleolar RNA-associated protein MPP10